MQGLRFMDLERGLSELSKYIWVTKFGQVDILQLNFEFNSLNRFQINRQILFEKVGLGGKGNWATRGNSIGPAQLRLVCTAHSAGGLTSGGPVSATKV